MSEKRVLVVEDERAIAVLLAKLVESCGVTVDVARNGREGMDKMQAQKPDLLLLDLIMPVMSGEQVLDAMEGDPDLCGVPVVIITTKQPDHDHPTMLLQWIRKPFEPAEVKRVIMDLLGLT